MKHYLESSQEVLRAVGSRPEGLTEDEAAARLAEHGKNKLAEPEKVSTLKKFFDSLADPMVLMLIGAAAVQAAVTVLEARGHCSFGDFADVIVILAVVVINTVMSLVQENKSEAAMSALLQMTAANSRVLRGGTVTEVKSEDVTVGDVVVLEAGDAVPADCRILEAYSLKAEEAALTGESVPASKIADILMCRGSAQDVSLGDRRNMLYSGTTVVYGRGRAVVTAVGMDTEMGRIADALSAAEREQTPLQKKMAELSAFLTKLVLVICAVVFAVGVGRSLITAGGFSWKLLGEASLNTFVAAIALAVAAIPEGLPAVVTIVLSIGVTAMAKRQALIRKLTAVETLGCTQVICTDKTGTLTRNRMTVVDSFTADPLLLAEAMACCNDARRSLGMHEAAGEPTEAGLVNHAHDLCVYKDELDEKYPRVGEAPFDSERKMMSTVHAKDGKYVQYTKGACEVLLERCTSYLQGGALMEMTDEYRAYVAQQVKTFADRALRVLGAAMRTYDTVPSDFSPEALECGLTFIGFTGMIDPCRAEVYDAITRCREAGIRPVMITGDHKDTAAAIGRELGIISDPSEAILGSDLDRFTDEEMVEEVTKYSVYARVQPEHKTRIVRAWRARGCVTGMTGDGVNDAPSIKAADIGIGMGITGTDVTKGAADMVLADDNFATIVNAVEEGRKIYDNVCKVLQFQLSTNMSEVIVMFLASLLGVTVLSPVHLLWINMVTDSLPGLALGMEKAEAGLMRRKPRASTDGIFSGGAGFDMVWQGLYIALTELAAYLVGYRLANGSLTGIFSGAGCPAAIAMTFLTVSFAEMLCAVNMRSRTGSILSKDRLKHPNGWLAGAFAVTALLTVAAVFLPGINSLLGFPAGTAGLRELGISFALALTTVPVFEAGKAIRRAAKPRA